MTVVPLLALSGLSDDESSLLRELQDQLAFCRIRNKEANDRYEGKHFTQLMGISVPPQMRQLASVAGWHATVVDVLEERLDWLDWNADVDLGLGQIVDDNALRVESGLAHLDALIYGTSFVTVGAGDVGEPDVLVTVCSPLSTTALWDARTRRVKAAYSEADENHATLYLPDQTVRAENRGGKWIVSDRDAHRLGRVPVAQMVNRPRASRLRGKSEMTQAVRYYTDAAMRTLLGMEVNREFYNSPQRYALGVTADDFKNPDGSTVSQWEAIMGRVWSIGRDEEGNTPEVGQFAPSSPAPYLDQVKGLAQMVAAEAGMPAEYMGFTSDNPASADAIRAGEARLVKRAERRQANFGQTWSEVAKLVMLVRDGEIPPVQVRNSWRDAATPTKAADADRGVKILGALPALAGTSVGMELVGMDYDLIRKAQSELRRQAGRAVVAAVTQAQPDANTP